MRCFKSLAVIVSLPMVLAVACKSKDGMEIVDVGGSSAVGGSRVPVDGGTDTGSTLVPNGGTMVVSGTAGRAGTGGSAPGLGGTLVPSGGTVVPSGGTIVAGGSAGRSGSSGGSAPMGGTKSSGGSTRITTGSCPSANACGGDVVGTWNVVSSCLNLDGNFDTRESGLGCDQARVTGTLQVNGSFVASADGKFQDKTTTTGAVTISLDRQCLFVAGTLTECDLMAVLIEGLGFGNALCTEAANGGCTCSATIRQSGNMGLIVADPESSGPYRVLDSTIVTGENPVTGAPLMYSYCASGNQLSVTPVTVSPPTTGTIVFQKSDGGAANACGELPPVPAFTSIPLPCEVVAKDGSGAKCVSAHSTVRTIVPGYSGPLYQLCSGSMAAGPGSCRGTAQDIVAINGYADVATHEAFCGDEACAITKIYDQSGMGNHLEPSPKGGAKQTPDNPAKAMALPIMINGRKAYGLLIKPGVGYRTGCNGCTMKETKGMALGDEPQTVYMVTSKNDTIDGCCFDYGNAETTSNDDGNGNIEAVYFGGGVVWGTGSGGKPGPWVMADLENGTYAGWDMEKKTDKEISTNKPLKFDFVTAVMVGDTHEKNGGKGRFALYGGDAQGIDASLGNLTCMYDGIRPEKSGYVPMQKQGSLVLGTSGDNSSGGGGRFFEGATITGPLVSKSSLALLHAAIVAVRYENGN